MAIDENDGMGGSYVMLPDGTRKLVERTGEPTAVIPEPEPAAKPAAKGTADPA